MKQFCVVLCFFTESCPTSVAHYSLSQPDRGTELEDQLPTLEEPNSLNEFLPVNKNNDCLVLEPDEKLTAVLSRCTNQAEPSNKHFTTDYLKDYKAPDNIICLPSTSKAPSAANIIFQDIEIKVTEDNIQEEHISPDDILENKIQNHENLHRSTRPITSSTENSSPLEDVLFWPKTPERKGKRNSELMPFVVSSKKWKALLQEKANKKAKLQLDKELRKKEREALNANKRKLKENKQKERNIIKTNKKGSNEK
ncbi:hypothetical protein ILUMI_04854 [Ignelater luminosus]|uniref:Uncharacterized protein n=1 Tax=Ignelater luminosus TaxID=2038154 RepID=A0A8K0GKQ4_IGNLU|nr:hypothetical protein ILUMI_04854 [Ignelater luminosus]